MRNTGNGNGCCCCNQCYADGSYDDVFLVSVLSSYHVRTQSFRFFFSFSELFIVLLQLAESGKEEWKQ